jgi:hypothetical protein
LVASLGGRPSTSQEMRSPSGTGGCDTTCTRGARTVPLTCTPASTAMFAAPGRDLQRRVVDRAVEDQDAGIDLQLLAVGEEGGVEGLHFAPRAQLAVLGGGEVDVAGELALQSLRADLEVVAEVEVYVERDRQRPALARCGTLGARPRGVVAELRQPIARHLDQRPGRREGRPRARASCRRSALRRVRSRTRLSSGRSSTVKRFALQAMRASPSASLSGTEPLAESSPSPPRMVNESICTRSPCRLARSSPLRRNTPYGRQLEGQRVAAHLAAQLRLAERAGHLQVAGQFALDATVGQQGARQDAHVGERDLAFSASVDVRAEGEAAGARARDDVPAGLEVAEAGRGIGAHARAALREARVEGDLAEAQRQRRAARISRSPPARRRRSEPSILGAATMDHSPSSVRLPPTWRVAPGREDQPVRGQPAEFAARRERAGRPAQVLDEQAPVAEQRFQPPELEAVWREAQRRR